MTENGFTNLLTLTMITDKEVEIQAPGFPPQNAKFKSNLKQFVAIEVGLNNLFHFKQDMGEDFYFTMARIVSKK